MDVLGRAWADLRGQHEDQRNPPQSPQTLARSDKEREEIRQREGGEDPVVEPAAVGPAQGEGRAAGAEAEPEPAATGAALAAAAGAKVPAHD